MKKIILLALATLMIVGCNENDLIEVSKHTNEGITETILRHGKIVDIDSKVLKKK